ncbi:MAG: tryptophan synthase subunit alpha [Deltaproteobacteria bacterium RBG_13_52_11b]|nr:MAG: tryptophan synthase subunit alpha [Deltaproteobacteria bacterium RBG_13_52_11b]
MSRIENTFRRVKKDGRAALIPFIVAGDPSIEMTEALVHKMAESGADIIELGVPFSDPIADGPTIQAASQRALHKGVNLKSIFHVTRNLRTMDVPLVLMTYFNPVFRYGLERFAVECRESGIDGVIIPDLPPEEAGPWIEKARQAKLDNIFLVAPTSPVERVKQISRWSRGFIYCVSVTGVTGARGKMPEELESVVRQIKKQSEKPVAVGFGVSTPEQARDVGRFADGVIVGSAIVKMIEENLDRPELITRVGDFVGSLSNALTGTYPVKGHTIK